MYRYSEFKIKEDKGFWAREYYVETIAKIDKVTVKRYIEKQTKEPEKGDN